MRTSKPVSHSVAGTAAALHHLMHDMVSACTGLHVAVLQAIAL